MSQNLTKAQIDEFVESILNVVGAVSGENNKAAVLDNAVREVLSNAIQKAQEIVKSKLSGLNVYEVVAICDELEARKRVAFEELYANAPGVVTGIGVEEEQGPLLRVTEAELRDVMEAVKKEEEEAKYAEAKAARAGRGKGKLKRV